jgi:hypothetical protein
MLAIPQSVALGRTPQSYSPLKLEMTSSASLKDMLAIPDNPGKKAT